MKINFIIIVLISLLSYNTNAQFALDDMEGYIDGQPISEGHWTDGNCGGGPGCALMSTSIQAQSGVLSGLIPNDVTTDAVLKLGNKIFGSWALKFSMYVPFNQEAYFNFQGVVPIVAGESIVGNIHFNKDLLSPGMGFIDNAAIPATFTFPHDQWFDIVVYFDLNAGIGASTWALWVNNINVVHFTTPFTNAAGIYPTSLGGIEFLSISQNNLYFLDDVEYANGILVGVETNDLLVKNFSAYPNPVEDILFLNSKETITSVSIYNVLGQQIYIEDINSMAAKIDTSQYENGIYFVNATIGNTTGTIKIIK